MTDSADIPADLQHALVNHLWQSTAVMLIIWLLTSNLEKYRASFRYRLWMLASVKFFVPLSFLVEFGKVLRPAVKHTSSVPIPQMSNLLARSLQPYTASLQAVPTAAIGSAQPIQEAGVFWIACLWVWGLGAFVMAALWLRGWLRLYKIARFGKRWVEVSGTSVVLCENSIDPGVFGIFKPVILLPEALTSQLPQPELDTIYAHELCHARRRDNLTAAFHAIVHSVFWFHPSVWIIRAKLMHERERACDELVLESGVDTETYARSIVSVCKLQVKAQGGVMAWATGGNLKDRIQRILSDVSSKALSPGHKCVLAAAALLVMILPISLGVMNTREVHAQAEAPVTANLTQSQGEELDAHGQAISPSLPHAQRPSFEVASVRAHDPDDRKNINRFQAYPGGRFTSTNCSLWMLIHYAFQIQPYQIPDKPSWMKSAYFDINAKPGETHPFDDIPLMLQGLLEDRFQLKYHWEIREQPVYELVVSKPGKLRHSTIKVECPKPFSNPDGVPEDAPCGDLQNSRGYTKGYKLTASELSASLSWILSKPIVNKTKLDGKYDVELRWTPASTDMEAERFSEHEAPDFFTAVQEQLGLKLQSSKGPVRVLVIDHVEKPSDN